MAASVASRGSDKFHLFQGRPSPTVTIELADQIAGRVKSYTTGDKIEGVATIKVDDETRFDEIEIILKGTTHTSVERVTCPGRAASAHMFLKLRQPIEDSEYPTPRTLEPGRSYTFPFTFVVPARLLPQVCHHSKKHEHVQQAHTLPPPTLGDVMIVDGKSYVDDMAPDQNEIGYTVSVSVKKRSASSGTLKPLVNHAVKVRIIPIVEEEPPIDTSGEFYYRMRKEKTVKRGFLRASQGKMIAEASQPKPIQLTAPNCETDEYVGTVAKVRLRFEPEGNEKPPRLGTINSKLKVSTFYGSNPWEDIPSQSETPPITTSGQTLFTKSITLSTRSVSSTQSTEQWTKHSSSSEDRRDSINTLTSDAASIGPSDSFSGDIYYTTDLVIPITLPKNKLTFVPTFHSCLMSRIYSIDVNISWHTPSTNIVTPSIHLRLPVQMTSASKNVSFLKADGVTFTQEEMNLVSVLRPTAGDLTPRYSGPLPPPEYSPFVPQAPMVIHPTAINYPPVGASWQSLAGLR